jgi:glycosyltransferase involved in cell wall biosynthesis
VTIGEPLPLEPSARLLRAGILAEYLRRRGHEVHWWTSTFDHARKRHHAMEDQTIFLQNGYALELLHSRAYDRNVSIARILNHREVARSFTSRAQEAQAPDLIVCSYPTIELSYACALYGQRNWVPVVLDVRDRWPDVIASLAPKVLRPAARLALRPMYQTARAACASATAIVGNTEAFVDYGLRLAGRPRSPLDRAFPFGYRPEAPSREGILSAEKFWDEMGVRKDGDPVVCFFGTIGRQFDFSTIIRAARRLNRRLPVKFVLCGTGDYLAHYTTEAADCDNVVFPGWIDAAKIWVLMRRSIAGIAPYVQGNFFEDNLTNKPIEYLSAGLPVLTSLSHGVLPQLLREHQCGFSYAGDPQVLQEHVADLCCNPESRRAMVRNADQLFKSRYSADTVYEGMTRHLERVVQAYNDGGG